MAEDTRVNGEILNRLWRLANHVDAYRRTLDLDLTPRFQVDALRAALPEFISELRALYIAGGGDPRAWG